MPQMMNLPQNMQILFPCMLSPVLSHIYRRVVAKCLNSFLVQSQLQTVQIKVEMPEMMNHSIPLLAFSCLVSHLQLLAVNSFSRKMFKFFSSLVCQLQIFQIKVEIPQIMNWSQNMQTFYSPVLSHQLQIVEFKSKFKSIKAPDLSI